MNVETKSFDSACTHRPPSRPRSHASGKWKCIYRFDGGRLEIFDEADNVSRSRLKQLVTAPDEGYVLAQLEPK